MWLHKAWTWQIPFIVIFFFATDTVVAPDGFNADGAATLNIITKAIRIVIIFFLIVYPPFELRLFAPKIYFNTLPLYLLGLVNKKEIRLKF